MTTKLRITGGPLANSVRVYVISADGRETELEGIACMKISDIEPGLPITVALDMCGVELDIDMEAEVLRLGGALPEGQTRNAVDCPLGVEGHIDNVGE